MFELRGCVIYTVVSGFGGEWVGLFFVWRSARGCDRAVGSIRGRVGCESSVLDLMVLVCRGLFLNALNASFD